MTPTATEVIRRGFDNTVANWPLVLIRFGEGFLFMILAILAVVAIIVPIAISLGLGSMPSQNPADAAEFILNLLVEQWMMLVYAVLVVTLVLTIFVAIHSFVEAGSARVYVDGELKAGPGLAGARERFHVFSIERWAAGGRNDWWSVFWIYNFAWFVASLIMLVPALAMLAILFASRDNPAVMMGVGCAGFALFLLFVIVVAVVTNIWCQKAIVVCVARTHRAVGSLGEAWREFRGDAGRHIAVALIMFLLMIVGTGVFSSMSALTGISDAPSFTIVTLPVQLVASVASSLFSAIIGAWFIACFVALSVKAR